MIQTRDTYESPKLTRFGSFRELTLAGTSGNLDGFQVRNDGCGALGTRCS
jgi:hypothetical protein